MARIRQVSIKNFRSIKELTWLPSSGVNCLIGPGDSGKSSILDAIDFCLGARRNVQFTDADFYRLNVETPIEIMLTVGELNDALKSLDAYGMYLRGFCAKSGKIEDEPEKDSETVLTIRLQVGSDLEPSWALVSDRASAQGQNRVLSWNDRLHVAPTRIGLIADYHLGWGPGSVLNRVSEERADASAALAKAARDVRDAFGDQAAGQLGDTLQIVSATAKELGITIGENAKAMLDAHSVSFKTGTISLHDENGIPLRGLGVGSKRLLIAGLQRTAAAQNTILLIDELEHGLEPHRIVRLLGSLGAKEKKSPLQVFLTTHSPVVLQELAGDQLFVLRPRVDKHEVRGVGTTDEIQSTIRLHADAFLAGCVIVCEGASEVGLMRGLDQYRAANGEESIGAHGASFVDTGGGDVDRPFVRAGAFHALGYRVAVIRDADRKPTEAMERAFTSGGGKLIAWRNGRTLEDELFLSLTNDGIRELVNRAIELHGAEVINQHVKSASENGKDLDAIQSELGADQIKPESRRILGKAARKRKAGWFKSVTWMEGVSREIVGPHLANADEGFRATINEIFSWVRNARAKG